jgi:hypothetical protein
MLGSGPKIRDASLSQFLKQPSQTVSTDEGMQIDRMEEQSAKASVPTLSIDLI